MKIAFISEDGVTISQHFGQAPYYLVLTVEDGKVISKEKRDKMSHRNFASKQHTEAECCERHGYGANAQTKHADMMSNIADCQVLIAGRMGWGAYEELKSRAIETIITDVKNIDEAVRLYLKGELPNLMERLH